jgi:hypothetical protein
MVLHACNTSGASRVAGPILSVVSGNVDVVLASMSTRRLVHSANVAKQFPATSLGTPTPFKRSNGYGPPKNRQETSLNAYDADRTRATCPRRRPP